jgi:tetratricopeptide (TPR) repeat protein
LQKEAGKSNTLLFIYLLAIPAVSFLVYSNSFHSPFQFDDDLYIIKNRDITDLSNFWPPFGTRYFTFLTFALNYYSGGMEVLGFHAVNFLIHAANGLLVFALATVTFNTPCFKRHAPGLSQKTSLSAALLISLIFVSHPVQTEAVAYISQRFTSLAAFFYLASLTLFAKWRADRASGAASPVLYVLSVAAALMGQMTKEICFTLPFVIALYDFTFFSGGLDRKRAAYLAPFMAALLIIPLTLLNPELVPGTWAKVSRQQVEEMTTFSRYEYLITQFRVIVTYLRLIVLPVDQQLDYDYTLFKSFFTPQVFLSFILLAALFIFSLYLLIRSHAKGGLQALAAFGILWFFITLSIESSIVPIKDLIFEHRLYLPSVGAAFVFGYISISAAGYIEKKRGRTPASVIMVVTALTVIPLGTAAHLRNNVWSGSAELWEDVLSKNQGEAMGYINLANAYVEQGRVDEAISRYKESLKFEKVFYPQTYFGLGNAYLKKGMTGEAIAAYKEAVRHKPDYLDAHYNLGNAYASQGMLNEALSEYGEALRIQPDFAPAHFNTGNVYNDMASYEKAISSFETALRFKPEYPECLNNLGAVYLSLGRIDDAVYAIRKALEYKDFPLARQNLANAYMEAGRYSEAAAEYREALRMDAGSAKTRNDLGTAYYYLGRVDESIVEFNEALKMQPGDADSYYNLGLAYLKKGDNKAAAENFRNYLGWAGPGSPNAEQVKGILKDLGP